MEAIPVETCGGYGWPSQGSYSSQGVYLMNVNYQKFKQNNTTNIAEDKGSCLSITTRSWNKKTKDWDKEYNNLAEFDEVFKTQKQSSCGLTHNVRNCIVVDIDKYVHNPEFLAKEYPLQPNYINRNNTNGHAQLTWLIDEIEINRFGNPTEEHRRYLDLTHTMNAFNGHGDLHFTGWQRRNLFYTGKLIKSEKGKGYNYQYSSYRISTNKYTIEQLIDAFGTYKQPETKQPEIKTEKAPKEKQVQKGNKTKISDKPNGRNNMLFLRCCSYAYYNETTFEQLFDYWKLEREVIYQDDRFIQDHELTDAEGMATCKSVLKYKAMKTLKPGRFTLEQCMKGNQKGLETRRANAEIKAAEALKLLKQGKKKKEVTMILRISRITLDRWLKKAKSPHINNNIHSSSLPTYVVKVTSLKNKAQIPLPNTTISQKLPQTVNSGAFSPPNTQKRNC